MKNPFEVLKNLNISKRLQGHPEEVDGQSLLFLEEMKDVVPLKDSGKRLYFGPIDRALLPPKDPNFACLEHLDRLVKGYEPMDIVYRDDYVEAQVPVVGKDVMSKLREGKFSYQAYLDLHGLSKEEAEKELLNFITRSYSLGKRCVLVIHGKGYNSKGKGPILKEMVPKWLQRSPVRKLVLAFCSARPYDGGTGALYVLLRRWRRKGKDDLRHHRRAR